MVGGGGLHVVVGTSSVVVVVDSGVWILGSNVWLRQPRRKGKRGKRGSKATVSTHPKYSQARIYTTYASVSMKWVYLWTELQNARREGGKPSLSKTMLLAASILQHVEESRLKSSK